MASLQGARIGWALEAQGTPSLPQDTQQRDLLHARSMRCTTPAQHPQPPASAGRQRRAAREQRERGLPSSETSPPRSPRRCPPSPWPSWQPPAWPCLGEAGSWAAAGSAPGPRAAACPKAGPWAPGGWPQGQPPRPQPAAGRRPPAGSGKVRRAWCTHGRDRDLPAAVAGAWQGQESPPSTAAGNWPHAANATCRPGAPDAAVVQRGSSSSNSSSSSSSSLLIASLPALHKLYCCTPMYICTIQVLEMPWAMALSHTCEQPALTAAVRYFKL